MGLFRFKIAFDFICIMIMCVENIMYLSNYEKKTNKTHGLHGFIVIIRSSFKVVGVILKIIKEDKERPNTLYLCHLYVCGCKHFFCYRP